MKNVNKCVLILIILSIVSIIIVYFESGNKFNNNAKARRLTDGQCENIIEEYESLLPKDFADFTDINIINESVSIDSILGECLSVIKGEGSAVLYFLLLSLSMSVIVAVCGVVCDEISLLATRCVSLTSLITIVGCLMPLVDEVAKTISSLSRFLLSLIPILCGISTSLGHMNVATSQATSMSLVLAFFGGEGAAALTTVVKCLFILAILSVFTKEGGKLFSTTKNVFIWGIGSITTLLSGIMSLQTLISRGADNGVMMATRYAISNMLPIAGSVVSGALSTLVSGMSYYATIVGTGAMAVIILTALSPLISLLMYKTALSIVMIFLAFIGADGIYDGVKSVSGALDALIALYSVTLVIYSLEIMLFLRQGIV